MDKPTDFDASLAEDQKPGGLPATGMALELAFSGGGCIGSRLWHPAIRFLRLSCNSAQQQ